jgi:hypothetical protein
MFVQCLDHKASTSINMAVSTGTLHTVLYVFTYMSEQMRGCKLESETRQAFNTSMDVLCNAYVI